MIVKSHQAGGAVTAALKRIRAYHGSIERNLKSLNTGKAVETRGTTFHATNPDVAETFTFPREYGEPVYYNARGREIKRGRVYETDLTPQKLYEVPPDMAQKFIDDTAYQGGVIREAAQSGHDAVVARNVLEGIGERYRGDVYATLKDDIAKILRKYGLVGGAATPAVVEGLKERRHGGRVQYLQEGGRVLPSSKLIDDAAATIAVEAQESAASSLRSSGGRAVRIARRLAGKR